MGSRPMIIAKYYRNDLVNGEPTVYIDYAILPSTGDLHALAVEFAAYRPTAVAYKLFEGDNFRSLQEISLAHSLV
mgnify:CR=1 FL=1